MGFRLVAGRYGENRGTLPAVPDRAITIPTRVSVEARTVLAAPASAVSRQVLSAAYVLAGQKSVSVSFLRQAPAPGPIAARWTTATLNQLKSQPEVDGEIKAAVDYSDGIMVALMIPETLAATIAVPDGQPAKELHVTLAYLGSVEEVDDDSDFLLRLLGAVRDAATQHPPLSGMLSGLGRFTGDEQDALYLSVDVPGLEDLRHAVVEALTEADVEVNREHGFTPHVTLAYLSRDAELPWQRVDPRPVEFTEVAVVYGENVIPVALGGAVHDDTEDPGVGDPLPTTTSATVNRVSESKGYDPAARVAARKSARAQRTTERNPQ